MDASGHFVICRGCIGCFEFARETYELERIAEEQKCKYCGDSPALMCFGCDEFFCDSHGADWEMVMRDCKVHKSRLRQSEAENQKERGFENGER
jgi:hypothetical protein